MISARAVISPSLVGFVLLENVPASGNRCEVLVARGGGGGQHVVLAQLELSCADGGCGVEDERH